MIEYKGLGEFELPGRGTVISVYNDKERANFSDLIGGNVLIDGEIYQVRGVERFPKFTTNKGEKIGLLVTKI